MSQASPSTGERLNHPPYAPLDPSKPFNASWEGKCHCGDVTFQVHGNPLDVKYCHCKDCQRLHAAPAQWAAIFEKHDILITSGHDGLEFYNSSDRSRTHKLPCEVYCRNCHTAICDEGRSMIMLMPTLVKMPSPVPEVWRTRCHIFYGSRVVDINDGTPKWSGHKDQSEPIEEDTHTGRA